MYVFRLEIYISNLEMKNFSVLFFVFLTALKCILGGFEKFSRRAEGACLLAG